MHLKKLEMQGFKSFPDKTVIVFDKGMTVIVGPNGSGKSNISDAMRWVLGEISSKNIRGTKMEDVIFAGSQGRSPMNFAEVSVTFDNTDSDGKLLENEDYDEITVTRRYYRVGDSEYFINKKPVRLKDIHELFFNTGLGKGGYSIIGQGKIAEIISRKNDERRAVFEEAAGIAKYKYQKQEATRNLEQTQDNLTRLEDITGELEARIGPLKRESEKAKKYLEIYDRKKELDISVSLFDIDIAKKSEAELTEKLTVSATQLENETDKLSEQEKREANLTEKQSSDRMETERLTVEMASRTEEKHKKEADILVCEKENTLLSEQIASAKAKQSSEEALSAAADKELAEKEAELQSAVQKREEKEKRLAEVDAALAELSENLANAENDENDTVRKKAELDRCEMDAKIRVSALEAQKEADRKKYAELSDSADKSDADIALYDSRIATADKKLSSLKEKEDALQADLDTVKGKLANFREQHAEQEKKKNDAQLEITSRKHKMQNLIRMDELLEGFSRAVRFVMSEYTAGHIVGANGKKPVLYGPLSKLISVDEKYAVALETAFGANLQNIVVQDENSAKTAIDYLKHKNAGRATFYPVETMQGTEADIKALSLAGSRGFIALASTLVSCEDRFRPIVRSLVGRILIAEDMDAAATLAKALQYRFRIVTLDGQVINAGGSFTGGSTSTESPFLSRRAQIDKLQAEITEWEKTVENAEKKAVQIAADIETVGKQGTALEGSLAMTRHLTEAESTQLEVLKSGRAMIAKTGEDIKAQKEALSQSLASYENDISALAKRQDDFDTQALLLQLKESELKGQHATLSEKQDALFDTRSDLQIELAKENTNIELLSSVLDAVRTKAEIYHSSLATLLETVSVSESKIESNKNKTASMRESITDITAVLVSLEERRNALSTDSIATERQLSELRARQKDTAATKELMVRSHAKIEGELEAAKNRADMLLSFLWDDYELSYTEAQKLCTTPITQSQRSEAVAEQTKLKNIIRSLGNVNVGAIEEYKEVSERYGTMHEQIVDLQKSKEALLLTITDLEQKMCSDFATTIENININFGKVFSELFGGGHAEIRLSEPDNVLESGIEINVAPPGKIIKSLSLLSGGEQAFVAIALYFAILKVNPAPFCIMDEIEAALDEVNVDKFADYVKHYADKTQFVLITHRRGTMEAAERLYGVTMHEKGISDIMSVDVAELEARLGKTLDA